MTDVYRVELKFDADSRSLEVFVKDMVKGGEAAEQFDRSLDVAGEGVSELELRLSSLDKQLDRISKLEGVFRDIAISGVAMAYTGKQILDSYLGLGGELVKEAAEYQYMGGIFGILLGDPEKGEEFNRKLDEITRNLKGVFTPEVQSAAMTMLGFGLTTGGVIEYIDDMAVAALTSKKPIGDLVMQVARLADPSLRGQTATQLAAFGLVIENFGRFATDEAMTVEEAFAEMARYVQENIGESADILSGTFIDTQRIIEAQIYRIKRDIGLELIKIIEGPLKRFADWLTKISKDEKFREWIHRFTEGLRQMGTVLMWIFKAAKWVFDPIIEFLKRHPELAGWIAGLTGLGAVLLIVAGGALALFGNFGMLIMSKKALMLQIERYNIEGKIAAATMQTQAGTATNLAGGLHSAALAQGEYNTQLELFNAQQLAGTGKVGEFGKVVEGATDKTNTWAGAFATLGSKLSIVALEMYGVLTAWTWLDRHTGIGSWLGNIMSWGKESAAGEISPEVLEKVQKGEGLWGSEIFEPTPTWKRGKSFMERIVGPGPEPEGMPPISPEDIYGGGGAGGDGRATETGPQINTYYITQHFEDGSVQILPEGEFDAEGFLTEMEALAPG